MPGRTFTAEERKRGGYARAEQPSFVPYGKTSHMARKKTVGLTKREQEVMRHCAAGETTSQIATSLLISPHTVKNHLTHIFNKLGASNKAEAVAINERRIYESTGQSANRDIRRIDTTQGGDDRIWFRLHQ